MQFNMKVQFRLCSKLDALTHRWDIYMEGDNTEATATNMHPVFASEQLTEFLVLAHTTLAENPKPSTTDHDALTISITAAYTEDDLATKLWEQLKTTSQEGWTEREGHLYFCE